MAAFNLKGTNPCGTDDSSKYPLPVLPDLDQSYYNNSLNLLRYFSYRPLRPLVAYCYQHHLSFSHLASSLHLFFRNQKVKVFLSKFVAVEKLHGFRFVDKQLFPKRWKINSITLRHTTGYILKAFKVISFIRTSNFIKQ